MNRTLPRNGLSGVEKTDVANVWKKSRAESGSWELRRVVFSLFHF